VKAAGQDLLNQAVAGSSEQQMPVSSVLVRGFSGATFYQLKAIEEAAIIGQLKPRGRQANVRSGPKADMAVR
jgi:hypothetical protein